MRALLAASLSAAARVLSVSSSVAERAAAALRPARHYGPGPGPYGPVTTTQVLNEIDEQAREQAGGQRTPAPGDRGWASEPGDRARRPESSVAALAQRTAAEVVAAVGDLSTDELRQLYEYETTHRNRKSVLRAIAQAAAPGPRP